MVRCAVLLMAVGAVLLAGRDAGAAEPVFLEGFEAGRDAWQPVRTGEIDGETKHSGDASMMIADADDGAYFTTTHTLPVEPDSLYEVSFWCLSRDGEHPSLCIVQQREDGQTAEQDGKRLNHWRFPFRDGAKPGEWVQGTLAFATGPETVRCSLILNPADGLPERTGTAWFDDISLAHVGPVPEPVERAEESLPLSPLAPLRLELGSDECAIVCPSAPDLRAAAEKLAQAIERATGRRPEIADDTVDLASLGRGPLLVMGNLMVGAVGRKLYFEGYDFTDYAWPGRGGHVVRTIRDPFGTGAHVLMIGGSYPEDIAGAAARVEEIVADEGPVLGYLNDVRLGENADLIEGWTADRLEDDAEWKKRGTSDAWQYLHQVGRAAMGYLRTGDEAYLVVWKREMLYFLDYVADRLGQGKAVAVHSLIDASFVSWDLFADAAFFSAEERREIDEKFLWLACSAEGPRPLAGVKSRLRENHGAGRALDAYWFGRYFWRRYHIEEAREWMAIADRFFASQFLSSKPNEDSYYYQYQGTLLCTLMYALAADREDYLHGRALREAAERAVMEARVGRGAITFLGACAMVTDDPGYLSTMAHAGRDGYVQYCADMSGDALIGENLRSFCGCETPTVKQELLGACVAPLDPMWHNLRKFGSGWTELVVTTTPEESYDKLVIRDAFRPESFYLKIDGLYDGGHSFPDANCIASYQDRGVSWLTREYGRYGPTCSTVRQQNGVFVALDGKGPDGTHACARLLYAGKLGDDLEAVASSLEGRGDVKWERHVLRRRDAWTLVVDRAVAEKQGELLVERHWHVRGDVTAGDDGLVSRADGSAFHLQSAGLAPDAMSGTAGRAEIVRADLPADGHVDIASLIFVDDAPEETRYRLAQTSGGWRVSDTTNGEVLGIAFEQGRLALSHAAADADDISPSETLPLKPDMPTVALPWGSVEVGDEVTAVATGHDCFAGGARDGTVRVFEPDGAPRWQAKVEPWVLSLHFLGDDLLVGEDNGTISRFDGSGRSKWSVTIPYVKSGYPHWSDQKSRVREITSADITGDGAQEILLANGDRRLYAFTGSGELIWKREIKWGNLTALTPTTYLGEFALFAGTTRPTLVGRVKIHDAEGEIIGRLSTTRMLRQQIRDVRLFDLTGDGAREIVVAREINSNQLVVCNEERDVIWQTDVGGSPDALAIRNYEGETQVLCGSRGGYLHAFEGATGRHLWHCYLGDEPRLLWPRADGSILAISLQGNVFVVGPDGGLVGRDTLPAPVTALPRPGEHRVDAPLLPVGTSDGTIHLLTAAGR